MGWFDSIFGGHEEDEEAHEPSDGDEPDSASVDETPADLEEIGRERYRATVLFPFPFDWTYSDVEDLLESHDISFEALETNGRGTFRLEGPTWTLQLQARDSPFPEESMNRRLLPEGFPEDHAHVGIAGDPERASRSLDREPDPWRRGGEMRVMTQLVRALLERDGTGVVLHAADHLVLPSQQFLESTGDLDREEARPFSAWIDFRYGDQTPPLKSSGLSLLGVPELEVSFEHVLSERTPDSEMDRELEPWRAGREREALLFVAAELIHGRLEMPDTLADFEGCSIDVPLGFEAREAHTGEMASEEETTPYRVESGERDSLEVRSTGPSTVWEHWASIEERDAEMPARSYRLLCRHVFQRSAELGQPPLSATLPFEDIEELPTLELDIYRPEQMRSTLVITNGLGRLSEVRDALEGTDGRVELAVQPENFEEWLLDLLFNAIAGFVLERRTWSPGDILEFEESLHGFQSFVLDPLVRGAPPEGPPIDVWQMVPLESSERASIEGDRADTWVDQHRDDWDILDRWERISE